MNGQWIGPYSGTNVGLLVIELDDVHDHYDGVVVALNKDPSLPAMFGEFNVPKGQTNVKARIPLAPIERDTGNIFSPDKLKGKFPGITSPTYAESEWIVSSGRISIKWSTDINTNGEGTIIKSEGDKPSTLNAENMDWVGFKNYASGLEPYSRP